MFESRPHNSSRMQTPTDYRGRRAAIVENEHLRVTVVHGGGHIAEILDKATGVNPLWTPPWPSIEPAAFNRAQHDRYGAGIDAGLLAGILGHNLCLDIFGGPSDEEAAAGMPVHGEASSVTYDVYGGAGEIVLKAHLTLAELQIERKLELHGRAVRIRESVENLGGTDRPIGWTQHVTLGPPFLENGTTEFRASATRSRVFESTFGTADYLQAGADFEWPHAPGIGGGTRDLRRYSNAAASSAYTAHLMDPAREHAFFVAWSPSSRLAFGYVWRRSEFPWMGIWEENRSRTQAPWNGETVTRGMEFGVSPFPESRRQMVDRGRLFDTPGFRWIPAGSRVGVEYWCVSQTAASIPETLEWPSSFADK
jgi:hypothetical protein